MNDEVLQNLRRLSLALIGFSIPFLNFAQQTYAERLGFPKDAKVLILHVDDAGMSWDSNEGAKRALQLGVANSVSVMMPCPWVPGFIHFIKTHPEIDAGLHLTLTSEWEDYRWGPLSGKTNAPGLVDQEGALWGSVAEVVEHASPQEVAGEITAQLDRALTMGFQPTHLDSHMGTLFATPDFMQAYVTLGIQRHIPVMVPGGHNTMISEQENASPELREQLSQIGQALWAAGLPVLDDLHNVSYDWTYPKGDQVSDEALRKFATARYIETIRALKPGLTMVIMHCTWPSEVFSYVSGSGRKRKGDLLAMTDPAFKTFLQKEGIILTTWREVMRRRQASAR